MSAIYLSKIFIYPIKSLRGIEVTEWNADAKGLLHDRRWMLVDANNHFLSQRKLPRMALIATALTATHLQVSAPEMPDLIIPLAAQSDEELLAEIWHDHCVTKMVSAAANLWFSAFLGVDCKLVYQPESSVRQVDQDYAHPADETSLSDGFPFLLVSENSLHALNSKLALPVSMARFRPNLVVSGCDAFAEDTWREISIGNMHFRLPKPCSRCSVPNVDPMTAATDKEPIHTLNSFRKWQNKIYFGQNAIHNATGSLQQHMPITILRTGEQQPPLSA